MFEVRTDSGCESWEGCVCLFKVGLVVNGGVLCSETGGDGKSGRSLEIGGGKLSKLEALSEGGFEAALK